MKKIHKVLIAAAVSVSLVVSAVFLLPAPLKAELEPTAKAPFETSVATNTEPDFDETDDFTEKKRTKITKQTVLTFLRAFFSSALGLAGTLALKLAGLALSAFFSGRGIKHTTLISFAVSVLINFVIIAAVFCILFKKLYPSRSLREFLTLRNLLFMFFGSLIISTAGVVAETQFKDIYILGAIIECLISFGVVFFVWYKTFRVKSGLWGVVKKLTSSKRGRTVTLFMLASVAVSCAVRVVTYNMAVISAYVQVGLFYVILMAVAFGIYRFMRGSKNKIKSFYPAQIAENL